MSIRALARPVMLSARHFSASLSSATPLSRACMNPALSSSPSLLVSVRAYSTPAPTGLDQGEQAIYKKLSETFPGQRLEVQDVSGGCGSFYAILISSPKFNGLSTIKQHKLVNACLKEDIQGIHGLQLKTIPEEE